MTERILIGHTKPGSTKAGRATAELFSTDTRLSFPVLVLFDLSLLTTIGLDPDSLPEEGVHLRYWAHYTLSEKLTAEGNPYRDVTRLERETPPANANTGEIVAELFQIRALLERIADRLDGDTDPPACRQGTPSPVTTPALVTEPDVAARETVTSPLPHNYPGLYPADKQPAEQVAAPGETEAQASMREFYDLAGKAIQDGAVTTEDTNELVQVANDTGWPEALASLKHALAIIETYGI